MAWTPPNLTYKGCWQAPGYRQLTMIMADEAGREYELHVAAKDLQRIINECADAAKQIGAGTPIDWDDYPHQVYWPQVTPWIVGPKKKPEAA